MLTSLRYSISDVGLHPLFLCWKLASILPRQTLSLQHSLTNPSKLHKPSQGTRSYIANSGPIRWTRLTSRTDRLFCGLRDNNSHRSKRGLSTVQSSVQFAREDGSQGVFRLCTYCGGNVAIRHMDTRYSSTVPVVAATVLPDCRTKRS